MTEDLIELLGAGRGIVCAVGAGGKKTTLQRLAGAHKGRCALTATVPMTPLPEDFPGARIIAEPDDLDTTLAEAARHHRVVGYGHPFAKPGRQGGVPPEAVARLHRDLAFDTTLVKADGARMRGIKAPAEHEPNLPPGTTTVLYLVSIKVLGQPLNASIAHRSELLARITGAAAEERLTAAHLARLLVSPAGAAQGIGNARLIPVINQADTDDERRNARLVVQLAFAAGAPFERVVIAAMNGPRPVRDVIDAREATP